MGYLGRRMERNCAESAGIRRRPRSVEPFVLQAEPRARTSGAEWRDPRNARSEVTSLGVVARTIAPLVARPRRVVCRQAVSEDERQRAYRRDERGTGPALVAFVLQRVRAEEGVHGREVDIAVAEAHIAPVDQAASARLPDRAAGARVDEALNTNCLPRLPMCSGRGTATGRAARQARSSASTVHNCCCASLTSGKRTTHSPSTRDAALPAPAPSDSTVSAAGATLADEPPGGLGV
jgi:hypothetical protein